MTTTISKGFYVIRVTAEDVSLWNRHSHSFWLWQEGGWNKIPDWPYLSPKQVVRLAADCGRRGVAVPAAVAAAMDNGRGIFWTGEHWF